MPGRRRTGSSPPAPRCRQRYSSLRRAIWRAPSLAAWALRQIIEQTCGFGGFCHFRSRIVSMVSIARRGVLATLDFSLPQRPTRTPWQSPSPSRTAPSGARVLTVFWLGEILFGAFVTATGVSWLGGERREWRSRGDDPRRLARHRRGGWSCRRCRGASPVSRERQSR